MQSAFAMGIFQTLGQAENHRWIWCEYGLETCLRHGFGLSKLSSSLLSTQYCIFNYFT